MVAIGSPGNFRLKTTFLLDRMRHVHERATSSGAIRFEFGR